MFIFETLHIPCNKPRVGVSVNTIILYHINRMCFIYVKQVNNNFKHCDCIYKKMSFEQSFMHKKKKLETLDHKKLK